MFCGTPVIAYNRGSMPELIENNLSGLLVNNLQEAIDAISAVEFINRRKCYEYGIAKFSMDTMIDNYIKAYETILSK